MSFRPSVIEEWLSEQPIKIQKLALQVIIEEHDRWDRGDLTDREIRMRNTARAFGEAVGRQRDKMILDVLSEHSMKRSK